LQQILQNLKDGRTELAEVPCPRVGRGALLIRTTRTLISAGTERMLVDFGKANPLEKARQQPDKVRQVLEKVKTDGLAPTLAAVRNKLEQPLPLGYCHVGVVVAVGDDGHAAFAVGDRVVSNGKHAEMVSVPVNLCARIPDGVSDEAAAFTVIGAIALQGIRLVAPTLGEAVVVTGLGLIGLLTVQLLRAQGCRVLGIDLDPAKLALARRFGAETVDLRAGQDPLAVAATFTRGRGVDAVIITAATRSNEPVHQAAQMCRQRGRIVLVGVVGLELSRADFYEKELSFQVSCSYGPGRYDPRYEEQGLDYPIGFVRWTEQRNFEAVLDLLAAGRLDVAPLVSHRFALAEAERAYAVVGGAEPSLGILLEYPGGEAARLLARTVALGDASRLGAASRHSGREAGIQARAGQVQATSTPTVSFIGAGNYATGVLIQAFKAAGAVLRTVASSGGVSGVHAGRKFGFAQTTTDTEALLTDTGTTALVITTRHDSHARWVRQGLAAGKAVFVEKPLCLTLGEWGEIAGEGWGEGEQGATAPMLMVGFNRRFAPQVQKIKELLAGVTGPKAMVMTVNAGAIPAAHWTQDPAVGGGRIIGEACHFIDLLRFLAGAPIERAAAVALDDPTRDSVSINLRFADGSLGTILYLANGSKAFPKERLEVFAAGRVLQLDNFRKLTGYGWPGFKKLNLWRQDKGQQACAAAFVQALRCGGPAPIPLAEILEVSRVTIEVAEAVS
jgi:predicted dehydrogenase/threonine dehydrogenase-like Zn-dependent dehydrogenase